MLSILQFWSAARVWYEGYSTFHVGDDNMIFKHVADTVSNRITWRTTIRIDGQFSVSVISISSIRSIELEPGLIDIEMM